MKKNLFEMGANFDDGWSSNNKDKPKEITTTRTKEPNKHQLHFAKEKRRVKTVIIVKPFYLDKSDLHSLVKTLKKRLGTGGTVKENSLEFQGDVKDMLYVHLEKLGYRFKH
jgi:translation initiation factor 1